MVSGDHLDADSRLMSHLGCGDKSVDSEVWTQRYRHKACKQYSRWGWGHHAKRREPETASHTPHLDGLDDLLPGRVQDGKEGDEGQRGLPGEQVVGGDLGEVLLVGDLAPGEAGVGEGERGGLKSRLQQLSGKYN